jgi:hypothetical protein
MAGTHQKSDRNRDCSSDKGSILLRLLFLSLLTAVVCLEPAFAQWPQAQSAPTIVPVPKKPFKRNVPTHPVEPSESEAEDTKLTLLGQYGELGVCPWQ